jgi:hypothetical protein
VLLERVVNPLPEMIWCSVSPLPETSLRLAGFMSDGLGVYGFLFRTWGPSDEQASIGQAVEENTLSVSSERRQSPDAWRPPHLHGSPLFIDP